MIYQALEHLVVGFPRSLPKASMLKADRTASPVAKNTQNHIPPRHNLPDMEKTNDLS